MSVGVSVQRRSGLGLARGHASPRRGGALRDFLVHRHCALANEKKARGTRAENTRARLSFCFSAFAMKIWIQLEFGRWRGAAVILLKFA